MSELAPMPQAVPGGPAHVANPADAPAPMRVIEPTSGWHMADPKELWAYRELLYFFIWRDMKVRFKQTALGVAWIVLRPLLSVLAFVAVFGKLAKIPSDGLPYAVFVFAAMLPWTYFAAALQNASGCLVAHAHLITKTYFPRLLIPLAAVLSGLVDLLVALVLALVLMAGYRLVPPPLAIVTVPLLVVLVVAFSVGVGLWLGALNVRYRDVGALVPFLLQIWMYASPVVYPVGLVPAKYRWVALLNPMSGIIEGFRSALLRRPWDFQALSFSVVFTLLVLVSGLLFFRATERTFADTI